MQIILEDRRETWMKLTPEVLQRVVKEEIAKRHITPEEVTHVTRRRIIPTSSGKIEMVIDFNYTDFWNMRNKKEVKGNA